MGRLGHAHDKSAVMHATYATLGGVWPNQDLYAQRFHLLIQEAVLVRQLKGFMWVRESAPEVRTPEPHELVGAKGASTRRTENRSTANDVLF